MVSRITIFEPHFEGIEIDTGAFTSRNSSDEADESGGEEPAGSRSRLPLLAGLAMLSLAVFAGYRGMQRDSFQDIDTEQYDVRKMLPAGVSK